MCLHGRPRYLPDLPILSIFEALPLYKLLKTDRVCPRFAQLQAVALANRKALTIFIGENVDRKKELYESTLFFEPHLDGHTSRVIEEEMAEFSALEVKTLDGETVNWLKGTFPRVTKLRLVLGPACKLADFMANVNQLLEPWSEKLETLGIWISQNYLFTEEEYPFAKKEYPFNDEFVEQFQSLLTLINDKLYSLQYLAIDLPLDVCPYLKRYQLDFSFLGRLKQISTNINPIQLLNSLHHHGAILQNQPEIRLFNSVDESDQAEILEMPLRLASTITALWYKHSFLGGREGGIEQLKTFFGRLPSLKWFKLSCRDETNIYPFLVSLSSSLSQLTYLELAGVPFHAMERSDYEHELPPFPSVETLSISGSIRDHHFLQLLGPLDHLFPVLKCIQMDRLEMDRVSADIGRFFADNEEMSKVGHKACQAVLQETVSALMRTFAGLRLGGNLTVIRHYYEKTPRCWIPEALGYEYTYMEKFNFADGSQFQDWQYKTEKVMHKLKDKKVHFGGRMSAPATGWGLAV